MYNRKITPGEIVDILKNLRAPYGKDYKFQEIDTSECEEFFGTRCQHNVHVTGKDVAHIDRVDPRKDLLGHIDKDIGIPSWLVVIGGFMATVWILSKIFGSQERSSPAKF